MLKVIEQGGEIHSLPVVVYPENDLQALLKEIDDIKAKIASGECQVFDSVDALIENLEAE